MRVRLGTDDEGTQDIVLVASMVSSSLSWAADHSSASGYMRAWLVEDGAGVFGVVCLGMSREVTMNAAFVVWSGSVVWK